MSDVFIIPVDMIPKETYIRLVKEKVDAALAESLKYIKVAGAGDVVRRELKPKDLGLNTVEWVFNVAAGENTILNFTLDDKTYIYIYEIFNLSSSPATTEIMIGTPSGVKYDIYIEGLYAYPTKAGVLTERIEFKPGNTYIVKVVAKAANTAEKLGFRGIVVEPKGRTVSPQ